MMVMVLRRLSAAALAGALLAVPLAGCNDTPQAKVAKIDAGAMPLGAQWDGVYYSELFGNLHLVQKGVSSIVGKWERPSRDKWGEARGEVTGDVIRFAWSEYTKDLVGPNAKRSGKGYFKYRRPAGDNVDDTIVGEIGTGQDEQGQPWEAIKQRNVPPDLGAIGVTSAAEVGGGDWDTENKETGKPEGPVSPH